MYHYGEGSSSQHGGYGGSQNGGYGGGSQNGGYGGGSSFADEGPTELLALGTSTGQIAIFNLAANAMVAQHQIAGGHRIRHVKFSNDGQRVYATNEWRHYEFSAKDLALRVRHVKFSDDGQKVYATNNWRLYEFSAENLTLGSTSESIKTISVCPTGNYICAASDEFIYEYDYSGAIPELIHLLPIVRLGGSVVKLTFPRLDPRAAACALSRSVGENETIARDVTWTRNISGSKILSLAVTPEATRHRLITFFTGHNGGLAAEYTRQGDIVRALPINLGANVTSIDYFSSFTIL